MKAKDDRILTLVEKLVKAGELKKARAVSKAELASVEKELGHSLPSTYVRVMERVGAIGKVEPGFAGWSSDARIIAGPKEALALTKKLRADWGKEGRHVAYLAKTFFFLTWEITYEHYGVDDQGQVRKLREHRPGTLLKVEAKSVDEILARKLGEVNPAESTDDASDPDEVTDLVLDEGAALPPVMKLARLERLTLSGIDHAKAIAILGKHPSLTTLTIGYGDLAELPDALFAAPSLAKIDLGRTPAAKLYGAGLDGLLAWFHEAKIANAKRPLYVHLLADDASWVTKHANSDDLLVALDAPNDRVAEAAHRALASHLASPKSLAKAVVALLGKSQTKADALAAQLEAAGATLEKKLGPRTTHALVGLRPKEAWREARKRKLPLLHEDHLRKALDAKGARFLATKEAPERLRELLLAPDETNVALATQMMEQGGVPDGVIEAILLALQNPKLPAKTRKSLDVLGATAFPDLPRIVREVLARTNLFQCGATKLADRLSELEKKSKGKISARRLALDLLRRESEVDEDGEKRAGRALLYVLETGDVAFAKEGIALARDARALSLAGLEVRIGAAVDKVGAALVAAKGITKLSFQWTYLRELPKTVTKLTALETLLLADNDLKTLPDALASLTHLRHLDLSSNRFGELPPVIAKLRALEVLEVSQHESKPHLRELPPWLADLPKLTKLVIADQKNVKKSPVLEALRARGVTVE